MSALAVYPGTFDPITFGHMDIVYRALTLFDKIIIGVATSQAKKPMFSLEKRLMMAKKVFQPYDHRIQIIGFDSLLADFMKEQQATVLLRGLRAISDFEYEFQMAGMNRQLRKDIETVFLMPAEQYQFISSTIVREVAGFGGDVSSFVPKEVLQEIKIMNMHSSSL